jgi:hypothetical protein
LDPETRSRVFVRNAGLIVSNALYLSLFLWTFGITGEGRQYTVGQIPLTFSPLLLLILVSLFVLAYLVPYLAGSQRAKRWGQTLLGKQRAWLNKIIDSLERPTPKLYVGKLEPLREELAGETEQFVEDNAPMQQLKHWDAKWESWQDLGPTDRTIARMCKQCQQMDPRFRHIGFLEALGRDIDETVEELKSVTDGAALMATAEAYAGLYRARQTDLARQVQEIKETKPQIWVGLAFLLTPIVSQALSEIGKWVSTIVVPPGPP